MLRRYSLIRKVAAELGKAAQRVERAYRDGDAPYEVDLTGRLLGAVVDQLDGKIMKGVTWRAKQFRTGKGFGAEEKTIGADFMGFLDMRLRGYAVQKGFLVQAKRAEPDDPVGNWSGFKDQLEKMLAVSSASYAFIYSKERGIRAFPAQEVVGLKSRNIFTLYDMSFERFFEDHLKCQIGDPGLTVPKVEAALDEAVPARRALVIKATDETTTKRDTQ